MKKICSRCDFIMEKTSQFTLFDFAMLKTALLSAGALIGTYFSRFLKKYQAFLWLLTVLSYIYLVYRIFLKDTVYCRE